MADLAHDASGAVSWERAGIALQQAGRAASPDRGKLRVFISYSRDDLDFADQLDAALAAYGFECLIDRHGISGGEDWKRRLGSLISEADTVVFVLTPNSARSPICDWEVEEATRLNKRILPIVCRPLEGVSPPPRLRELNYIFFYKEPKVSESGFGTGLASLVAALNTDFDWLREHTRYLQRAMEWQAGGRPANRLLSGNDIREAKAWASARPKSAPEPTPLHLDFIRVSEEEAEARSNEQRKQLEMMAAAQAERETALHKAEEALKQAAVAQRKRARVRNIAVAIAVFAAFLGLLSLYAEQQKREAVARSSEALKQRMMAEENRDIAQQFREMAEKQRTIANEQAEKLTQLIEAQQDVEENLRNTAANIKELNIGESHIHIGIDASGLLKILDNSRFNLLEASANVGVATSMTELGRSYENAWGVAQDYGKAREWYEKAAARGDGRAKIALERLPIREAETAGRYDEALRLQETLAAKVEAEETKRDGKPGEEVATELNLAVRYALFAKEFTKALTVADRAHTLFPDSLGIETNRAHALMFMGRDEEAKGLYLAHKGEAREDYKSWKQVIAGDFAKFRKAGLTTPMMADIEKELDISTH
jgi:TPR repeat protein